MIFPVAALRSSKWRNSFSIRGIIVIFVLCLVSLTSEESILTKNRQQASSDPKGGLTALVSEDEASRKNNTETPVGHNITNYAEKPTGANSTDLEQKSQTTLTAASRLENQITELSAIKSFPDRPIRPSKSNQKDAEASTGFIGSTSRATNATTIIGAPKSDAATSATENTPPNVCAVRRNITTSIDCHKYRTASECVELGKFPTVSFMPLDVPSDADSTPSGSVVFHEPDERVIRARFQAKYPTKKVDDNVKDSGNYSLVVIQHARADPKTGRVEVACDTVIRFNQCGMGQPIRPMKDDGPQFQEAVFVAGIWSQAYFHSIVENLPRLVMIFDFLQAHPNVPIVVHPHSKKFLVRYATEILGIPANRFVFHTSAIRARTLFVPEPTPCGSLSSPKAVLMRKTIQKRLSASAMINSTDILVIRRKNYGIDNHDALMQSLRQELPDENVVVYDEFHLPPPGLPQLQAFANAKVIIGPHGAGLSNILAARPETAIVELMGSNKRFNPCYVDLTVHLGMEHHPLAMYRQGSRTVVDVKFVAGIVREIVENQSQLSTE